jgi:hypothetical protein
MVEHLESNWMIVFFSKSGNNGFDIFLSITSGYFRGSVEIMGSKREVS